MKGTKEQPLTEEGIFLPDFCSARSVLVVVIGGQLLVLVLVLASTYYQPFSYEMLGLLSLFVQWIGLSTAALLCWFRKTIKRLSRLWASLLIWALVVVNTFVFSLLAQVVTQYYSGPPGAGSLAWTPDIAVNVVIAAIIAGVAMRYFYVLEQLRINSEAALQGRIQALQARIRPHFLFNSMNIISSLIKVDPDTAEQVVEDLSSLFRASLQEPDNQVTLTRELALCHRYMRIEQLRLGERLTVDWQVQCDPEQITIPMLTLQPLLENAVYHGIQPLPQGGCVRILAHHDGANLTLEITNPLPDKHRAPNSGNRMALENIRHRLDVIYGGKARMEAGPDNNNQFRVTINYPIQLQGGINHAGTGLR